MQTRAHNRRVWRDWNGSNEYFSTEPTKGRQVISWHPSLGHYALWHFLDGITGPRFYKGTFDSFRAAAEAADLEPIE